MKFVKYILLFSYLFLIIDKQESKRLFLYNMDNHSNNAYSAQPQTAILVGVDTGEKENYEEFLDELERLVEALDLEIGGQIYQELKNPHPATYIGSGKLAELAEYVKEEKADYVVFADTLSPAQLRNISDAVKIPVFDRTSLILEIFKRRARTREAKLQVEMANLQYMLPRLVGMWTFFGRQGGASGSQSNRGAGEKQLELDRRTIEKRLSELRRELKAIDHDRGVQRNAREQSTVKKVALVGYTNAGKSTLMNRLLTESANADVRQSKKEVFVKDMLFATLDTTVRRIYTDDNKDFLISDTVGFVSELPHGLIKAFKSTLDEVRFADLLLLVVDASDANAESQIKVTSDMLRELNATDIPRITVMNKADKLHSHIPTSTHHSDASSLPLSTNIPNASISDSLFTYDTYNQKIYISASTGEGIDNLLDAIKQILYKDNEVIEILIPYNEGAKLGLLNEHATILLQEYKEDGIFVRADCPKWLVGKVAD